MKQNQVFDAIRALTGTRATIVINTAFIEFCGDYKTAAFLSQLIYWSDRGALSDGWIAKSLKDWSEELFLSRWDIDKAAKFLKNHGLETKLQKWGGAPVVHYRLNPEIFTANFVDFLQNRNDENSDLRENDKSICSGSDLRENDKSICEKMTNRFAVNSQIDMRETRKTYTEITDIDYTEITTKNTLSVENQFSPARAEILEPEILIENEIEELIAESQKKERERKKTSAQKKKEKEKEDNFPEFTFSDFWDLYNKKVGRDRAEKLWEKLSRDKKLRILTHLADYLPRTEEQDRRFRVKPEKYLREEYFNDETTAIPINPNNANQTKQTRRDERKFSTSDALSQLID